MQPISLKTTDRMRETITVMAKHTRFHVLAAGLLLSLTTACSLEMPGGLNYTGFPRQGAGYGSSGAKLGSLSVGAYNQQLGQQLADYAVSHASGGTGQCYAYVAKSIHAHITPFLWGMHAYMAADQLAASSAFREISLSADQLASLPAGAVVVWDKGSSESGHISIADGQGREVSDHVEVQLTAHYGGGSYRVFLPV